MQITDSQILFWDETTPRESIPHPSPQSLGEVLEMMDSAGVGRAVLVPPTREGSRNDLPLAAARQHPERFGVMGSIDFAPRSSAELQDWYATPGMLGARLTFLLDERKGWLSDRTLDWFWHAASTIGMPVMLFAPGLTNSIGTVARRFPDLRLIVNHLNLNRSPESLGHGLSAALDPLLLIADFPNIAVNISALPNFVDEPYPYADLQVQLERVINAFGPHRCMWGSGLRLKCSHLDWVRIITEQLTFLTDDDRERIMNGTVSELLNWPAAPTG